MFKKVMVGVISASLLMSNVMAVAAPFGSKSSSSSSRSSSFSSPSRSSSSFSAPSRQSSFSSTSRNSSSSSSSRSYGGISQGSSVGMTRSDVSNRVRNGTNVAPANETTVAGRNPGGSSYNSNSYANNRNYNNNYNNGNYNNGYNNSYNQPRQGHSTGALIGAAAAGAIGGYMLNGILHNRDGSVYNGAGYHNGVPVQNYNTTNVNGGAVPTVADNGGNYNSGYNTAPSMGASPVIVQKQSTSFWWSLLGFLLVILVVVVLWKMFFGRKNSQNEGDSMFNNFNTSNSKSPEAELRDSAEQMFINFQKNNKPSGLSYIQSNSTPMLFEAIRDNVESGSENRRVTVKSLEARLEDITENGSQYVGSVSYRGVVVEQEAGHDAVETPINELWNYVYDGRVWKLAGIEQL